MGEPATLWLSIQAWKTGVSYSQFAQWIFRLTSIWKRVRKKHSAEIERINRDFMDPELLSRQYVEPFCQVKNPANRDERTGFDPTYYLGGELWKYLNRFLARDYLPEGGENVLFLLSDAGMGKSSTLVMLKLKHLGAFVPSGLEYCLMKLGEETLDEIEKLENRRGTVLLLDSLDEDKMAWNRTKERLSEILQATRGFRQVVITCRTQFFPREAEIDRPGRVAVEGFVCNLLYLSRFSDDQVREFFVRSYPNPWWWWFLKWAREEESNAQLSAALELVDKMGSLEMRPMLLAYSKYLIEDNDELQEFDSYLVHQMMVTHWLRREETKLKKLFGSEAPNSEQLREACCAIAIHLREAGQQSISDSDIERLIPIRLDFLKEFDVGGRSLLNRNSAGDLRFSHYSIAEFLVVEHYAQGDSPCPNPESWTHWMFEVANDPSAPRHPQEYLSFSGSTLSSANCTSFNFRKLDFRDADLRSAELRLANLNQANLLGATLEGANLSDANLSQANLQDANLEGAFFGAVNLRGARLQGANLQDANLEGAWIEGARFAFANLQGANLRSVIGGRRENYRASLAAANLEGARLQGANLRDARLEGAYFKDANLQDANLQGANLQNANFHKADLRGAALQGADFQSTQLRDAILSAARLQGVNLRGATLEGADLQSAKLQDANFHEANFLGANLHKAHLQNANLEGAWLAGVSLVGANLQGANLRGARLRGANLRNADLEAADLEGASLQGANLLGANLLDAIFRNTDLDAAFRET